VTRARQLITARVLSSKSRGYIATTFHRVAAGVDAPTTKLDSGTLRQIIKGETGHTAERLCDEMEGAFVDLAKMYITTRRAGDAAVDVDGDGGEEALALAAASLRRVLAITTDGGANMCKAAALLMHRYQRDRVSPLSRARLCICHTLQLVLKHMCNGDSELSSALAVCNFVACSAKFSEYAYEALGFIPKSVSTRWSSQLTGARAVCQKKQAIVDYCATPRATDAFRARVAALRAAGGDGFQLLDDFYNFLSPLLLLTDEFGADKRCTANKIVPKILDAAKKIETTYATAQQTGNHRVVRWYEQLYKPLYNYYIDADFVEDELFQVAALLDPNGGGKKLMQAGGKPTFDLAVQTTVEYIAATFDDTRLRQTTSSSHPTCHPRSPPSFVSTVRQQLTRTRQRRSKPTCKLWWQRRGRSPASMN
jgi:hypothetical protein